MCVCVCVSVCVISVSKRAELCVKFWVSPLLVHGNVSGCQDLNCFTLTKCGDGKAVWRILYYTQQRRCLCRKVKSVIDGKALMARCQLEVWVSPICSITKRSLIEQKHHKDIRCRKSNTLFNLPVQTLGALICHSRLYLVHGNGWDSVIKS